MGQLYDAIQEVDRVIQSKGLDESKTRGLIGLKAGFFLIIIRPDTEDDATRLNSLRLAAEEILCEKMSF